MAEAIKKFQDILAWKRAHELVLFVYRLTEKYPKHELFALVNQSRRCAVSIPSNIAEGFKRRSRNDSIHFYNIAQGSLEELKYQLLLAKDLSYVGAEAYEKVMFIADEVGKLVNGWIKVQR